MKNAAPVRNNVLGLRHEGDHVFRAPAGARFKNDDSKMMFNIDWQLESKPTVTGEGNLKQLLSNTETSFGSNTKKHRCWTIRPVLD